MIKSHSISQQSQQSSTLSSKLKQIKQLLTAVLQQKNSSKYKNLEDLARRYVQNQQSRFNKKTQLVKQNMIMSYELSLLINLLSKIGIDENSQLYMENKNNFDSQIKLKEANKELERKIKGLENQIKDLKQNEEQKNRDKEKLEKKLRIYEKKIDQFQKLGGSSRIQQLKQNQKKLNDKIEVLCTQNEKFKIQIKKLTNKCKILQELNSQTQSKVASILAKQNVNRNKSKDAKNRQKQIIENNASNPKIQLLAAKEEIRELKNKIQQLQKQKQIQKSKYEQKQTIYQKMVMKKLRN